MSSGTGRAPRSAPPPTPIHGTRLDGRLAIVDSLKQVRLLRAGRYGQTNKVIGQANVRKDAAGVVVEVKKGARLQVEDTWATHALAAGKSIRWVADQLGHADPALTLRVYAHALRNEETDLSFADFGAPERPYTAPRSDRESDSTGNPLKFLAPPGGLEPPTHGLGNWAG